MNCYKMIGELRGRMYDLMSILDNAELLEDEDKTHLAIKELKEFGRELRRFGSWIKTAGLK